MGLFDKNKQEAPPPAAANTEQNNNSAPDLLMGETPVVKQNEKKTTPDEGKVFNKETVFVCVEDCYQKGIRYHKGEEITGTVCPPHFTVKPEAEKAKK